MENYVIKGEELEKMFQHYISRKKYKQESGGQDTIWSAGECSEAEKWLSLFGIDLSYFRIQDMVDGKAKVSAFPHVFYGKGCNYAFHPVLSGKEMYDAALYAGGDVPFTARFHSVDECVLWGLYKMEAFPVDSFRYFTILGPKVLVYDTYEQLIRDGWETLTDINVDEEECTEQDWFLFPKGTHREEIWQWFDKHHEYGVADLLYGNGSEGQEPDAPYPADEMPKVLEFATKAGVFQAEIETREDTVHDSIYLSFLPDGADSAIDIAAIRDVPGEGHEKDVELLFFGDISSEDPTVQEIVTREEIEKQIEFL